MLRSKDPRCRPRASANNRSRDSVSPGCDTSAYRTANSPVVKLTGLPSSSSTRVLELDGKPISLTTGEFAVLYALVSHPGETLSRERLLALARGRQRGAFDRSIDVQMSRLRRIIEADSANPRYIQTVWGAGYVFVPDDSQ